MTIEADLTMSPNTYTCDVSLLEKAFLSNHIQTFLNISKSRAVLVSADASQETIETWAKTCQQAGKSLYLRIPISHELPQIRHPFQWTIKCALDRLVAALLLVMLSPLLLVLAGLICVQDGGPFWYTQWRVGAGGKLFRIYKFRSMVVNAESMHHQLMGDQPGLHKLTCDPRVTPLGKWLRKLSLDELPQLVNVLRGDMSLVGPRPWAIYDAVRVPKELRSRLNALPGITGAWQVEGRSCESDLYAVNRRDLFYLQSWRLVGDMGILLMTIPRVIFGSGAY